MQSIHGGKDVPIDTRPQFQLEVCANRLRLSEIALVLVRFDHIAVGFAGTNANRVRPESNLSA